MERSSVSIVKTPAKENRYSSCFLNQLSRKLLNCITYARVSQTFRSLVPSGQYIDSLVYPRTSAKIDRKIYCYVAFLMTVLTFGGKNLPPSRR